MLRLHHPKRGTRYARCARWPNPRYIVLGVTNPLGMGAPLLVNPMSDGEACRGRFSATGTSSSRCAYRTARPVAIRTLCDNNDNTIKQITVALGMGAPGNWHSHYLSRGGTPSWAKLHRPLRALAQSPLRPRHKASTCPQSDKARHPPLAVHGIATQVRKLRKSRRQTLKSKFTNPGEHVAKPCQPSSQT